MASDKLFYWLFQNQPDRIVSLLTDLPVDAGGYQFSAPVLKEREYRLDGLFLPPADRLIQVFLCGFMPKPHGYCSNRLLFVIGEW
jgi:predicted transposase YdaD